MIDLIISILCALFLFVVSAASHAETEENVNMSELWFNYAQDENEAADSSLDLTLALDEDDSLLIKIGESRSVLLDQSVITNQYLLGYSTIRLAPWSNTVMYEFWGKSNELVLRSISYDVMYFASYWSVGLSAEYRKIEFYTRELSTGRQRYDVDSPGIGINTAISSGSWDWSISGKWYDYSEDIQRLNTLRGLFLLGLKNFDHANTLNKWIARTGLYYRFANSDLGLGYTYAVSKISDERTATLALIYDIDLNRTVSLEMEAGRSFEEPDIETDYGLLAIGFRF